MYTWKEIPIAEKLEEELNQREAEFLQSLAEVITKQVMSSLRHLDFYELKQVIQKIQENPNLLGTLYDSL